jgi:hypothetical protein
MYWMTNKDHGIMPVENLSEVQRNEKHGWTFLNQGETPDLLAKPAAVEEVTEADAPTQKKRGPKPKAK